MKSYIPQVCTLMAKGNNCFIVYQNTALSLNFKFLSFIRIHVNAFAVRTNTNIQVPSPTSSVLFPGSESDSRISSSSSASEYSYGDSSNAFNMETLNLVVNSPSPGELSISLISTSSNKIY